MDNDSLSSSVPQPDTNFRKAVLVRLALTRMTETTDPQLQGELVSAFD
jgi:hypothetical protein